jgi:glycosyltransferase involved in cell wall biosynthesis
MEQRPLRIVHLAPGPYMGGYFANLARYSDPQDVELSFVTLGDARPEIGDVVVHAGCSLLRLPGPARTAYPEAGWRLRRFLHSEQIDILHAHGWEAGNVASLVTSFTRTRFVLGRHHADSLRLNGSSLPAVLDRWQSSRADLILVPSNAAREYLVDVERANPAKVRFVHYGMADDAFEAVPAQRRLHVRNVIARGAEYVVLVPARLSPLKGHPVLFSALTELPRSIRDATAVLLAGVGPEEAALRRLAVKLGVADRILFIGYERDLRPFYAASDIVVLPTLSESFGQVVSEAMAQGTPVIASAVTGVSEQLQSGGGVLVKPGVVADLERAIEELLGAPSLRKEMGMAGRKRAKESFGARSMTARYTAAYRDLIR